MPANLSYGDDGDDDDDSVAVSVNVDGDDLVLDSGDADCAAALSATHRLCHERAFQHYQATG